MHKPPFDLTAFDYAHRGLWGAGVPENSLAAYKAAADAGYGIEYDVRLSADGIPILYHDESLKRLTPATDLTASLDADALTKMHLAETDQTIPTLQDLLDIWPQDLPLLTELKIDGPTHGPLFARQVADMLRAFGGLATMMSFDEPTVSAIPDGIYAGQLIHPVKVYGETSFMGKLQRAAICRNDYICVWHEDAALALPVAISAGKPLMVYTVRGAAEQDTLLNSINDNIAIIFEHYDPRVARGDITA